MKEKIVSKNLGGLNLCKKVEERRLFYVALTRTKHTVSILCPIDSVSSFVMELEHKKEYYFGVKKYHKNPKCPNCGYPLVRNYWNTLGIEPLYECVNHRKKCGFQTNHLKYRIPIQSCKKCQNGYLIVKEKNSMVLKCTNCKNQSLIKKLRNFFLSLLLVLAKIVEFV